MKLATILSTFCILLGLTASSLAEPRGVAFKRPFAFRVVGGEIKGNTVENPVIIAKDGSIYLADRAVILGDKVRLEGAPEARHGNSVVESQDKKAWCELNADGAGKFSKGKWKTSVNGK